MGPWPWSQAWPLPWPAISGLVCPGLAWPGLAWPGLAWPGLVWPGLAWPGLAWPCLAWRHEISKSQVLDTKKYLKRAISRSGHLTAPWWPETDAGGEINMDRPEKSSREASGAELWPIFQKT